MCLWYIYYNKGHMFTDMHINCQKVDSQLHVSRYSHYTRRQIFVVELYAAVVDFRCILTDTYIFIKDGFRQYKQ